MISREIITLKPKKSRLILFALIITLFGGCNTSSSSTEVPSWSSQMSLVQDGVMRITPEAVLFDVTARQVESRISRNNTTLQVSLDFIRPSGELIVAQYEDTNITKTLQIDSGKARVEPPLSSTSYTKLVQAINIIQISPSEALNKTLSEGRVFVEQYGTNFDPL